VHKINQANIKDWAKNYEGPLFDGILCDPPYELGFMGKSWDSSGIAFDKDMWADLLRILKPGGHLLAFSGSRTYHRMAVAIEDAGFEIRDMIEYIYGSGFPKSLNIGKAVDKIQGNEREVIGDNPNARNVKRSPDSAYARPVDTIPDADMKILSKGTSPYEGYGTALKPAHEPCVLARKPIEGTVANNVLKHGTGGLNIDGSRVGYVDDKDKILGQSARTSERHGNNQVQVSGDRSDRQHITGRFPANLIHDGSDEVVGLFPDTGKSSASNRGLQHTGRHGGLADIGRNIKAGTDTIRGHNDNGGSAARFFYTAKASKSERNAGLEGFEEKATLIGAAGHKINPMTGLPVVDVPRANHHPTVKPLSLTKYLANLIKPPSGGRLLVPFSGSGSEMIGALQAGWEYVEGVELTEEYIPIAEARIKYWTKESEQLGLV
jgi:site-specific DNA-methyltransferase (adenine-specific)